MAFCHPFDDPAVVAGQGTLGLELVGGRPRLACVVVPLGGGGLASGMAIAVKSAAARRAGDRRAGRSVRSVRRAARHRPGRSLTLADGIAVKRPGELTGPLVERWVDDVVTVDEDAIADAMVLLMDRAKLYVEGAGAVGVAAVQRGRRRAARHRHHVHRAVRGQRRPRRRAGSDPPSRDRRRPPSRRLRRRSTTAPAAWSGCSSAFAAAGANLIEVDHQREGVDLHVRETGVHATFEVREPRPRPGRRRRRARRRLRRIHRVDTRLELRTHASTYWSVGCVRCPMTTLLRELEPTVETLLERHLDTHEGVVPPRAGALRAVDATSTRRVVRADADLGGASIDDAVRSSLVVNLLTEDNLPYYFRTIERMFGADGAWGAWVRRWTAEEGRHSMAIYGYLMVTRAVDPVALERARMAQVSGGVAPEPGVARRRDRLRRAAGTGHAHRPPQHGLGDRRSRRLRR